MQGLSHSQALICLLLTPFLGHKQTPGNTEALPLPSYSGSDPSHHGKYSFNFTEGLCPEDEMMQRSSQGSNLLAWPQWS